MADDDDTIYVDVSARLDERSAEQATGKLRDRFKGVGKSISDAVSSDFGREFTKQIGESLGSRVEELGKQAGERLGNAIGSGLKDLAGSFGIDLPGLSSLTDTFDSVANSARGISSSFAALKQGDAAEGLSGVAKALHDIAGDNAASDVLQDVSNKAGSLQNNFEGAKSGIKEVVSDLKGLASDSPAIVAALSAIGDAAAPLAAMMLGLEGGWVGINKIRDEIYGAGTAPPPGVDPQKWYEFTHGGGPNMTGYDPSSLFPQVPGESGEKSLNDLLNPPPAPPTTAPQPKGPPSPGFSAGGQTLLPPTSPSKPTDLGGLMGGTGTAGFTSSSPVPVTLVDVKTPVGGGGTVPLIQNPDGTWTSSNPSWAHLIQRESGGRNVRQGIIDINSGGNEAEGLFQITPATWRSHGGSEFAPNPLAASPQQQAAIAARILQSNPSGSDWGAGLPGRESASGLMSGLGGASPAGYSFYNDWYPNQGGGAGPVPAPRPGASAGVPGMAPRIPGGGMGPLPPPTQSNVGQGGPKQQQHLGQGSGAGVSGGGLIGAAEQAGVAAASVFGFGGGGIAAQAAEQEINLAVQKGSQLAWAAAAAPLETLWLQGGQMGAPTVSSPAFGWPGKLLSGLIGSQYSSPNIAGGTQPPKQQQQQDPNHQNDPANGNQNQGPSGSKDDPIHTKSTDGPQQQPQGAATSAANMTSYMAPMTV